MSPCSLVCPYCSSTHDIGESLVLSIVELEQQVLSCPTCSHTFLLKVKVVVETEQLSEQENEPERDSCSVESG